MLITRFGALLGQAQNKLNCDSILDSKLKYLENKSAITDSIYIKDNLTTLENCIEVDQYDKWLYYFFLNDSKRMTNQEITTYRDLIKQLDYVKSNKEFDALLDGAIRILKYPNQPITLSNIDSINNKLVEFGLSDLEINSLKQTLGKGKSSIPFRQIYWMYREPFILPFDILKSDDTINMVYNIKDFDSIEFNESKDIILFVNSSDSIYSKKMFINVFCNHTISQTLSRRYKCYSITGIQEFKSSFKGIAPNTQTYKNALNSDKPFIVLLNDKKEITKTIDFPLTIEKLNQIVQ